ARAHIADLKINVRSMKQPVETLSGGQRQGVAVARAAAFASRVVIMYEPTAALGVRESGMVLELIRTVRARGTPVVLISHNMPHRRTGHSGLLLPAISLGLWQNFGGDRPLETQRAIVRRAFDLGISHFDLANNYGPPYGSAEENFGRILKSDLAGRRDQLVISSKAGYDMWPGPYGIRGS